MSANPAERIRIVYFGTPAYAVPALEGILDDPRIHVSLVVTQPDRPAGRGRTMTAPPVKATAVEHQVPVYQPESLRTSSDREPIAAQRADLFVVAAFGKIFGPKLLALPKFGAVNLHASLLPQYRGASPISAAILEGRSETGVTLMRMDTGLDTGPVLAQRSLPIGTDSTTASLTLSLARIGRELLLESMGELVAGTLLALDQEDRRASITRPLTKSDGWIDWQMPAADIERHIRAMWDWPRAWTTLRGQLVQIHRASIDQSAANGLPGTIEDRSGVPHVATGDGSLVIEIALNAGGKPLPGAAWLHQSGALGERLGATGAPATAYVPMIRQVRP